MKNHESIPVWTWPLLVAGLSLAVYANSIPNGFALDDLVVVRDNPQLVDPDWTGLFARPYWPVAEPSGYYRPVTVVSLALNRVLTGAGPAGFHTVNTLLHALASLLVWFWARGLGMRRPTALLAAALFAVHPIHTEAVANISGRSDLLSAAFVLLAWLAHARARKAEPPRPRIAWITAAVLAYFAATLSKENAVLAPALFLFDDLLRRRETGRTLVWAAYGGYAVSLAANLALRARALGGLRGAANALFLDNPVLDAPAGERIATGLWAQVRHLALFVWPVPLSSDYSYAAVAIVRGLADPRLWAGLALLGVTVALVAWGWRRDRTVALAVAVTAVFLLPASNLLFPAGGLVAERLLYLPSAGLCLLAGHLAAAGMARGGGTKTALVAVSVAVLLALSARTVVRNPDWKDNASLALHDVAVQPRSAKLQAGAALVLHERGDLAGAERHYREAVGIWPEYAQMHNNLGVLLEETGRIEEAVESYRRASALAPHNPAPYKALAPLLLQLGRVDEAIAAYDAGAARDPADVTFRFHRARAILAAGRGDDALRAFEELARDDPGGWPGQLSAVVVLRARGETALVRQRCLALLERSDLPPEARRAVEGFLEATR